MSRLTQILRGKNLTPLTEKESAVKYAVDNAGSGGGGPALPSVTAADNGNVLTVVDGAWNKAAPSGGGSNLVITFDDDTGACDTKWSDIRNALADGKIVIYLYLDTEANTQIATQTFITAVTHLNGKYQIYASNDTSTAIAECATEDGYPVGEG